MLPARADQQVLGYLGRALSLELSAVQLYSTQARLVETWGLNEAADRLRHEAHEEMAHVERIIARLLAHGAAPNASQLRPVRLGHDLRELLLIDQEFERELIVLYDSATKHCQRVANYDDRDFFQALLNDERSHDRDLAMWIALLSRPAGSDDLPQRAEF